MVLSREQEVFYEIIFYITWYFRTHYQCLWENNLKLWGSHRVYPGALPSGIQAGNVGGSSFIQSQKSHSSGHLSHRAYLSITLLSSVISEASKPLSIKNLNFFLKYNSMCCMKVFWSSLLDMIRDIVQSARSDTLAAFSRVLLLSWRVIHFIRDAIWTFGNNSLSWSCHLDRVLSFRERTTRDLALEYKYWTIIEPVE